VSRTGWLGLTEISLPKVGFASIGCVRDLLNIFDRSQPKLRDQIAWTMDWLLRFPAPRHGSRSWN